MIYLSSKSLHTNDLAGVFVPFNDPPRKGKASRNVGWITDANGCDIWQGARALDGYALVKTGGRMCMVTRVRYEREVGPIPEDMELDHFVCDNGAGGCCNPLHCRPASTRENQLRGNTIVAANAAKTHCPKGHPLSGENLDKTQLARGIRSCRICKKEHEHARYQRIKASVCQ
jgi:hypothetical protein